MIETDYVLDATGRKPNVQQIGLEKVGIQFSDRGEFNTDNTCSNKSDTIR